MKWVTMTRSNTCQLYEARFVSTSKTPSRLILMKFAIWTQDFINFTLLRLSRAVLRLFIRKRCQGICHLAIQAKQKISDLLQTLRRQTLPILQKSAEKQKNFLWYTP